MGLEEIFNEIIEANGKVYYEIYSDGLYIGSTALPANKTIAIHCSKYCASRWEDVIYCMAFPEMYVPEVKNWLKENPRMLKDLENNEFGITKKLIWDKFHDEIIKKCKEILSTCDADIKIRKAKQERNVIIKTPKLKVKPVHKNTAVIGSIAVTLAGIILQYVHTHLPTPAAMIVTGIVLMFLSSYEHESVEKLLDELKRFE